MNNKGKLDVVSIFMAVLIILLIIWFAIMLVR